MMTRMTIHQSINYPNFYNKNGLLASGKFYKIMHLFLFLCNDSTQCKDAFGRENICLFSTIKPQNSVDSRSPKFCPLFIGGSLIKFNNFRNNLNYGTYFSFKITLKFKFYKCTFIQQNLQIICTYFISFNECLVLNLLGNLPTQLTSDTVVCLGKVKLITLSIFPVFLQTLTNKNTNSNYFPCIRVVSYVTTTWTFTYHSLRISGVAVKRLILNCVFTIVSSCRSNNCRRLDTGRNNIIEKNQIRFTGHTTTAATTDGDCGASGGAG
ncbi:hypothetical protein AGLY_003808 [Aphis glycines]|uniref:Uncharacterized protein n=1 Tax=Aphis glycines TaxID=307491 RepID=A0A6G0U0M9_APHGL|nr:hypothetical protein AGLY_003808 [Aphis glycines]